MTQLKQALIRFARATDGRIVHIDDVANGAACACHCPGCAAPLLAKNGGQVREHHFAHDAGAGGEHCAESALHQAAKQIVADYRRLHLPAGLAGSTSAGQHELRSVWLEERLESEHGEVVVDAYADCAHGAFAIEIAVTHFVDAEKGRKLRALALPTLEIDLSDLAGEAWGWNMLETRVLLDPGCRRWLPDELPLDEATPATVVEPDVHQADNSFERWQIPVGPGYVRITQFASGDHSVWHPEHAETVRKIVEMTCRGRGYWNRQYQNWIVFRPFVAQVLAALAESVPKPE